jgi:hypothetical protein
MLCQKEKRAGYNVLRLFTITLAEMEAVNGWYSSLQNFKIRNYKIYEPKKFPVTSNIPPAYK